MAHDGMDWQKLDRRLEGEPMRVGERRVRAVGRLTGKTFQAGDGTSGGAGAFLTLQPEELIVEGAAGPLSVSLAPTSDQTVRALFLAGGALAGACLVVMFLSRRLIRRML